MSEDRDPAPTNAEVLPEDQQDVDEARDTADRLEHHSEASGDEAGMRRDDTPPRTLPPDPADRSDERGT